MKDGALKTDNACSRSELEDETRIDLHSKHPDIGTQDSMARLGNNGWREDGAEFPQRKGLNYGEVEWIRARKIKKESGDTSDSRSSKQSSDRQLDTKKSKYGVYARGAPFNFQSRVSPKLDAGEHHSWRFQDIDRHMESTHAKVPLTFESRVWPNLDMFEGITKLSRS